MDEVESRSGGSGLHALDTQPVSRQLRVSLGQYSEAGRKDENQDFHGALFPEKPALDLKGVAIGLADGISSSAVSAIASETAIKSFLTDYYCTPDSWSVKTSAQRVIAAINSWLHAQNRGQPVDQDKDRGHVCTFSMMVLKGRQAHIFHIGDSRVYRLTGKSLEQLTVDHRVTISSKQSYLARALGVNPHVEIDYQAVPLAPGDVFMLATDGISEHVDDHAVFQALERYSDDLDAAARAIAAEAYRNGSPDNLTIQILRVTEVPEGDASDIFGIAGHLPPAPLLKPGAEFEGYAVLRELHSGSRSHVYLARDKANGARVALKVPATDHAQHAHQLHALLLEEWVARRIDDPHVLKAAPQRAARRHIYTAMEFVDGQPLDEWMHDHPAPEPAAIRPLVQQIAAGLQALHRREMIHRDLRPRNILVDADGTAKIIDFGSVQIAGLDDLAASRIEDAAFAGTMQYSAPELYLGQSATARSDIYSLGVIAYQMLTGRLPYGPRVAAATTRAAQSKLRYTPATEFNPAVPDWVDAAIAAAVAIDPARRYAELSEFTYDLARPNAGLTAPDPRPWLRRAPERLWQAISLILLCIMLILLWRDGLLRLRL